MQGVRNKQSSGSPNRSQATGSRVGTVTQAITTLSMSPHSGYLLFLEIGIGHLRFRATGAPQLLLGGENYFRQNCHRYRAD